MAAIENYKASPSLVNEIQRNESSENETLLADTVIKYKTKQKYTLFNAMTKTFRLSLCKPNNLYIDRQIMNALQL